MVCHYLKRIFCHFYKLKKYTEKINFMHAFFNFEINKF